MRLCGRVEHVVSGPAVHFYMLDALLTFMARVLTALDARAAEAPENTSPLPRGTAP